MTDVATKMTQPPTDHAELARLAESAERHWSAVDIAIGGNPIAADPVGLFVGAMSPALALALIAEVAALRGERDAMTDNYDRATRLHASTCRDLTEAERKLAEAVGLLRPFGLAADNMDGDEPDGLFIYDSPESTMISYGDLRAVRTFLASISGDPQ